MLILRLLAVDQLYPLIRSPPPEGPFAFCHLAKKKQEHVLPEVGPYPGIVECIVQGLHQPIKGPTKVHRSTVAIETVGFGITRQHVFFGRGQSTGAVIAIQTYRPDPRSIIGLLWLLLFRSPLSARSALEEQRPLFRVKCLEPAFRVVAPWLAVSSDSLRLHRFISASICARRACIWAILAANFAERSRPLRWI